MRSSAAAILLAMLAAPALAADAAGDYQTVGDYRWALYTACSLVFLCIVVYLVMSHRKGARIGEDMEHLERRIEALEE